ncbi:hypothetical protein DW322_18370 [Rhodococcus rhodnii]|uniref:Facilitated glucose transporter n=1 Tax=Rhodococcus rhodnii TaxID=38312 RepID=A0A6P2CP77_9NOCA|nr:hypothetical protein DW322_18370 [Rhodococcus rhodnii]
MPRRVVELLGITVLVVDGFLCAVFAVLFLPTYLGGVAAPVSVVAAAVVNVLLVMGVRQFTDRIGVAFAPLAAWLAGFVLCMAGGPGGDVLLTADVRTLLLFVLGLGPAAGYLASVALRRAEARAGTDAAAAH